jgi:mRNA-capping enzyme
MLEDEIIQPRNNEKGLERGAKSNPLYKYDMELFSVSDSSISEL